jgi:hypothetical protein
MASKSDVFGSYNVVFNSDGFRSQESSISCAITVNPNKKNDCYVLDYIWTVNSGNSIIEQNFAFPFMKSRGSEEDDDCDKDGVIVAKNEMTTQLIAHLCMPDEELQSICGLGTASDYRAKIIRSIATLWD